MPRVVAYEDAKEHQFFRRGTMHTPFIEYPHDFPREWPVAFLSQGEANRVIRPHYHLQDEFLVVTEGRGKLGRNDIEPYTVLFVRAFTSYGPIVGGSERGVSYFVLFPHYENDAQYLPEKRQELMDRSDRRPLQLKCRAVFDALPQRGTRLELLPGMKDDEGLAAYTLSMAPHERLHAPDPSDGDGQFILVVKGGLMHRGQQRKSYTVVFVEPHEGPFEVVAGTEGLQALVMNYPRQMQGVARNVPAKAARATRQWHCDLCDFSYDEAKGLPGEGIPPGTRWEDIPEDWVCPDCAATKKDFVTFD